MIGHGPGAAVDALSAAVNQEPGRADLWGELATALVAVGRAPEAWDAAVRAVELAPRSASSHRAIGTVAAALGDAAQAESAYRHASMLDPHPPAPASGRHASDLLTRMPSQSAVPGPAFPAIASRHAAPEDVAPTGRHGIPEPRSGGHRRAPEPVSTHAVAEWSLGGGGLATATWAGAGREELAPRTTAVGLPAWLGPVGPAPGPDGWARAVPSEATPVADAIAWRRGLIAVVRIEWLVGVLCFVGLAYSRTAPYTAGLLAGAALIAGVYGRRRWKGAPGDFPPESVRLPAYAAAAAAATTVVIIPAAMAGALTFARIAAVAAVTCATVASVRTSRSSTRRSAARRACRRRAVGS